MGGWVYEEEQPSTGVLEALAVHVACADYDMLVQSCSSLDVPCHSRLHKAAWAVGTG